MSNLADRMRREWNERAQLDPMHHVLNRKGLGEWAREDFLATGDENARLYLDPFCADQGIQGARRVCLEIGCGAGRETDALAARFGRVIALDVSDDMLAVARANVTAENVTFVRGSGVDLDVVDSASAGFAYSMIVFQHIPDPEIQYTYLREVGRVLRRSGGFLLHLYADEAAYVARRAKWQARADAGELRGWSEAARRELEGNRFETSMQTAVNVGRALAVLEEVGLDVTLSRNPGTAYWLVGGRRR
ncbi:MAG: methyltransferase domain-containing protein [Phycisphaerales bacterium]|nr:methyltransferase domain-containing protein [Phycisphaerales bacterium]